MVNPKNIFDVSKGNYPMPLQIALASPFILVTVILLAFAWFFMYVAIIIGRRPVFRILADFYESPMK